VKTLAHFLVMASCANFSFAQVITQNFGSGANAFSIDFVSIGNLGNYSDTRTSLGGLSGFGAVGYSYNIGKYEVTAKQYAAFLNSVASSDNHGLYSSGMSQDSYSHSINRVGVSGSYTYSVISGYEKKPIASVSWFNAARYVNWLQNGATSSSSTENGVYNLNGATDGVNFNRNTGSIYALPSENEWYKAAYYDPTKNSGTGGYWLYANKSDSISTSDANYFWSYADANGVRLTDAGYFSMDSSYYGTFDQSGNVWEWNESVDGGARRGLRGGGWTEISTTVSSQSRNDDNNFRGNPDDAGPTKGFRIVMLPEPSALSLLAVGLGGWTMMRRRRS